MISDALLGTIIGSIGALGLLVASYCLIIGWIELQYEKTQDGTAPYWDTDEEETSEVSSGEDYSSRNQALPKDNGSSLVETAGGPITLRSQESVRRETRAS